MDYQNVRNAVNRAIEIVDRRIGSDEEGNGSCQLDSIEFDQTFCDPDDEKDETMVIVHFQWNDVETSKAGKPAGEKADIVLFEDDIVSSYWIAGMVYAKILATKDTL